MIRIAICDDLQNEREILKKFLKEYEEHFSESFEISEYSSGETIISDVFDIDKEFDLIFLDIYMDGINGMETAKRIREKCIDTFIVFLTASSEFAIESYDVNAFGYLLKPFNTAKLVKVLEKINILIGEQKHYIYRKNGIVRKILYNDIVFFESCDHKVLLHLLDKDILEYTAKLNDIENELSDGDFLRCHQSFLINLNHVSKLDESFVMDDGSNVLIRKKDKKHICDMYYEWLIEEAM